MMYLYAGHNVLILIFFQKKSGGSTNLTPEVRKKDTELFIGGNERKEVSFPLCVCVSVYASACLPELTELFGLQEEAESSYGKLLRTMPRGLKVHWSSASSRGRQSLLPLALSVSDTASQQGPQKKHLSVIKT